MGQLGEKIDDELQFKQMQLDQSNVTNEKLNHQVDRRRAELQKIQTLDTKIRTEREQLEKKMQFYQEELQTKYFKTGEITVTISIIIAKSRESPNSKY